jgi:ribosomal protein S18 acetylase RimI-like enzyme
VSELSIRRVPYAHPDVVTLVERVQEFYVERYGGRDDDPTTPADFEDPTGAFFVGYLDDAPVTMGAWRLVAAERLGTTRLAEIKRMYVEPALRGRGLARRMLAHLEATAAEAGLEALILSTGAMQPEAIALYESAGYRPIEGFGHYAGSPLNRCYGKRLDEVPAGRA